MFFPVISAPAKGGFRQEGRKGYENRFSACLGGGDIMLLPTESGFERFFAEAAEWWASSERDMSRLATTGEKYGIFSAEQ